MPPIAWSNRRRAERAAILLATTDEPIAAIGARVGWPDPSYFSRRFRQEFGVGARTYRAQSHEHQAAVHPGIRDTTALGRGTRRLLGAPTLRTSAQAGAAARSAAPTR